MCSVCQRFKCSIDFYILIINKYLKTFRGKISNKWINKWINKQKSNNTNLAVLLLYVQFVSSHGVYQTQQYEKKIIFQSFILISCAVNSFSMK